MKLRFALLASALFLANAPIRSTPSLGKAESVCRTDETGPALLIRATGLKDRRGILRAELYPANDTDFLADDNILIQQGKAFRRVDLAIPATGDPILCMRIPGAGRYAVSLLHDRDQNLKFGVFSDGIGFSSNPKLGRSKPSAAAAAFNADQGVTRVDVTLNYFRGFSMKPITK
jgi:uncharacterized protein (DUF2141 family)